MLTFLKTLWDRFTLEADPDPRSGCAFTQAEIDAAPSVEVQDLGDEE